MKNYWLKDGVLSHGGKKVTRLTQIKERTAQVLLVQANCLAQ